MIGKKKQDVLLVAGPQGAGKTYLANRLTERSSGYVIAPGVVTRSVRNEEDGNDTQVTRDLFWSMSSAGLLCLETTVGEHHYAYLREGIDAQLFEGKWVIILLLYADDIAQAKTLWPDALSVYLRPADWDLLARRLKNGRGYGDEEVAQLLKGGRGIVADLDRLDWALRIDIAEGTEQAQELLAWLQVTE